MISLLNEYSTESHVDVDVTQPSHTTKVSMRDLKKGYYAGESFDELSSDVVSMEMEDRTKLILLGVALGGLAIGLFFLIRKLRETASDKAEALDKIRDKVVNEKYIVKSGKDKIYTHAREAWKALFDGVHSGDAKAREVYSPYAKRWSDAFNNITSPIYLSDSNKATLSEYIDSSIKHCEKMPDVIKRCANSLAEFNKVALSGDLDGKDYKSDLDGIKKEFDSYWSDNTMKEAFTIGTALKDSLGGNKTVAYTTLNQCSLWNKRIVMRSSILKAIKSTRMPTPSWIKLRYYLRRVSRLRYP